MHRTVIERELSFTENINPSFRQRSRRRPLFSVKKSLNDFSAVRIVKLPILGLELEQDRIEALGRVHDYVTAVCKDDSLSVKQLLLENVSHTVSNDTFDLSRKRSCGIFLVMDTEAQILKPCKCQRKIFLDCSVKCVFQLFWIQILGINVCNRGQ